MLNRILKISFVISIISLIFLTNLNLFSLNFNVYKKEFQKLNVYEEIPEADKYALNVINYHKNKEELNTFFNEKEKLHLKDVKDLINKALLIFYLSLILTFILSIYLVYKKEYKNILDSFILSSFIMIGVILFLLLIPFDLFFTKFHELTFSNNLWLLGQEDNLIKLFPQEFFFNISFKIGINILITSIILIVLSFLLKFKLNKKLLNNNGL